MKRPGFFNNIILCFRPTNLIILALLALFVSCSKADKNNVIPYASVNIDIYTSDPDFVDLNAVGGWTYITGGVRGIIVYRYSNDVFKAYDRDCPYDPTSTCSLVSVETNNIIASDPCCGSRFQLTDGSVVQGPATLPLQQYQTSWDGTVLHIYN